MGTQMPISHLQLAPPPPPPPDCPLAIPSNSNKTHSELVVHDLGSCSTTAAAEIVTTAIRIIVNPAAKCMHAVAAVTKNITTVGGCESVILSDHRSRRKHFALHALVQIRARRCRRSMLKRRKEGPALFKLHRQSSHKSSK